MLRPTDGGAGATAASPTPALAPLLAVTVLAGVLRFSTLDVHSLWADEGYTALIARGRFADAVIPRTESIPPLSYVLQWGWTQVWGDSPIALRALPALLGTLTVPAAYWAGLTVGSRRVGLLMALLTAVAPILVWYSQEVRCYALYTLLSVLALIAFLRAIAAPDAWRPLILWAAMSALALASHYFAVFSVAAQLLWLLVRHPHRARVMTAAVIPAATVAILMPLLLYQLDHVPRPWAERFSVRDQVLAVGQQFLVGVKWTPLIHRGGVAALALLAIAAATALLRRNAAAERRAAAAPFVVAVLTLALPVALAFIGPNYVTPRNVLAAWAPLALLVALGASVRGFARVGTVLVTAMAATSVAIVLAWSFDTRLQRDNWALLLAALGPPSSDRAIAVVDAPTNQAVVAYYRPRATPPNTAPSATHIAIVGIAEVLGPAAAQQSLPGTTLLTRRTTGRLVLSVYVASAHVPVPTSPLGRTDVVVLVER